jgi:hypothetical protein
MQPVQRRPHKMLAAIVRMAKMYPEKQRQDETLKTKANSRQTLGV